jgi:hypothetical protein
MKALIVLLLAIMLVGCGKVEETTKVEWITNIPEPHRSLIEMRILTAKMLMQQGMPLTALPPLLPETQYYLDKERDAYNSKLSVYMKGL